MRSGLSIFLLVFALIALVVADGARAEEKLLTGGQPTAEDLAAFAAAGGTHVIDLRGPGENRGFDEAGISRRFGMHYHSLPITGAGSFTLDNVRALDRLLEQTVDQHEKTLLHCASGNRVGALMALRAKWLHGSSENEALEIGRSHGMTSLETQVRELLREK
jgi:protein tyrosine phosphatase (PTP) superfamily phosphohydrolase (DUF442 family)